MLLLLIFNVAQAHGGDTAADGCHIDSSSGKKHCHDGTNKYIRKSFGFLTYRFPTGTAGYYTNKPNCKIEVEHVVALKDAYDSGAQNWPRKRKQDFANDIKNHVPACSAINRSKGSASPRLFRSRSQDGKGLEYQFAAGRFCDYVRIYHAIKRKYQLSFAYNDRDTFASCGVHLQ